MLYTPAGSTHLLHTSHTHLLHTGHTHRPYTVLHSGLTHQLYKPAIHRPYIPALQTDLAHWSYTKALHTGPTHRPSDPEHLTYKYRPYVCDKVSIAKYQKCCLSNDRNRPMVNFKFQSTTTNYSQLQISVN